MKSYPILVSLIIALLAATAANARYSGGTGDPNDPYLIATAADLNNIGNYEEDWYKHFILVKDVNLAGYIGTQFNRIGKDWQKPFVGVFDGNDHKILNFTWSSTGRNYIGLFGYVDSAGQIKNLGMENVDVNAVGSYVSGLVGFNTGTITNSYSTGSVSGKYNVYVVGGLVGWNSGTITNCYSTASVKGSSDVGGLVGWNTGTITNCYSTGFVSGGQYVGGLVGRNGGLQFEGAIIESYSTANVTGNMYYVGGLVGYNWGPIINCYSAGRVYCLGTLGVGGLVGYNIYNPGLVITASFWDIETSDCNNSAGGTPKTTAQLHDPNTFRDAGWDFVGKTDGPSDIWAIPAGGWYPILWWKLQPPPPLPAFSGGSGTPSDPYVIASPSDINSIGYNPRLMDKHFVLIQDINLAQERFYIIGSSFFYPFTGVFDGNGHRIWNFTWDSNGINSVGLFGYVESGGQIKNLGMENVDVNGVNGNGIGGLVGTNYYYATITNCYSSGTISGQITVGGLVAGNFGTITNCYSTASVLANRFGVGGLVAENHGAITDCYSTGSVSGFQYSIGGLVGGNAGTITNCYSTASVKGSSGVGGLVGGGSGGSVNACFWDVNTSGRTTSAGGIGKTTIEMKTKSTFTSAGWDFVDETANGTNDYWRMCVDGIDYPLLSGQFIDSDFTCPDGVDFIDFAILASAWQTEPDDPHWNQVCDISQPKDNFIDELDLAVFCENWLEATTGPP